MAEEEKDKPVSASGDSATDENNAEAASTDNSEEGSEAKKDEEAAEDVAQPPLQIRHQPSTIQKSKLDSRFGPRQQPISIMFLDGPFKGQFLDMGAGVSEYSESRTSNWEQLNEAGGVMAGMNFTTLNPQEFSMTMDYYDTNNDILQLVRCNEHLQSLVDKENSSPARLLLQVGRSSIKGVVCTSCSITPDPESALPGNSGFKHCTVQLQLKLLAGKGTVYELGPALGPNPLDDWKNSKTDAEREREGFAKVAEQLLSECLGEEGSEKIGQLIRDNKLQDPDALADLDARSFVNLASSGVQLPLNDERLKQKLAQDLATVMAEEEAGVNPAESNNLATSIQEGTSDRVAPNLLEITPGQTQSQYESLQSDYNEALNALRTNTVSEIDGASNPSLRGRSNRAFGCGLLLRESGFGAIGQGTEGDQSTLDSINSLLSSDLTDEQLVQALGLPKDTPEELLGTIRNGQPYTSKAQFVADLSAQRQQFTGHSLWASFGSGQQVTLKQFNELIAASGNAKELSEQLGISESLALLLEGKGNVTSLEDLMAMGSDEAEKRELEAAWWKVASGS